MYVKVGSLYDVMNESIDMNLDSIAEDMVDYSVNYLIETGDTYYLEALAYQDYSVFNEDDDPLPSANLNLGADVLHNFELARAAREGNVSKITRDDEKFMSDYWQQLNDKLTKNEYEKLSFLDKVINKPIIWIRKGRNFVAKLIQKLNVWMRKIRDRIEATPEDKRGFWTKIQYKIVKAIDVLSKYAHNFIQSTRGKIVDYEAFKDKIEVGKTEKERRDTLKSRMDTEYGNKLYLRNILK